MSSTTGLTRMRSVRKLVTKDNEVPPNKLVQGRSNARNASPSRLPMKPPTRSYTSSTTVTTAAAPAPAPAASTATTTTTTTTTKTTRARAQTLLTARPVSGSSSIKPPGRPAEHGVSSEPKPLGRALSVRQAPSTKTLTRKPSIATIRAAGQARPKSTEGTRPRAATAVKDRQVGHSRAKSTVTSLTAATTLRPLSHAPPKANLSNINVNANAPARSNPSPALSTSSSASTTTQTTTASSSTRAKTRSQTIQVRGPSQPQPQSPASTSASATATTITTAAPALAARRPVFNTNQKHYSPAKNSAPKPLTSTFLAPASPSKQPVNVAITAETSRLQTELLQLSLLHREAHSTTASWHASARSKLGARFEELAAAEQELRVTERAGAEARGLEDLIRWGDTGPQGGEEGEGRSGLDRLPLDEKIQLLDQVLSGAWALGEPGGRYRRAVRGFEDWVLRVTEIRAAQRSGDVDELLTRGEELDDDEIGFFVSDLDTTAWKRDHAGLVRVLESWQRTLVQLGDVATNLSDGDADDDDRGGVGGKKEGRGKTKGNRRQQQRVVVDNKPSTNGASAAAPPSSSSGDDPKRDDKNKSSSPSGLARTLRGCRSLVHDMLAELRLMERMELDALAVEAEWMEQMEAQLRAEEDDETRHHRHRTEDVPPWKLLLS